MTEQKRLIKTPVAMYVAWAMSLFATTASVYFIEFLHKPIATLCWVNRMLIFSIFLIITVSIITQDLKVKKYVMPFLIIGLPISFYEQLVSWNIIHLAPQTCSTSVVCTTKYFEFFGFITQNTLCFTAFLVVAIAMAYIKSPRNKT